MLITCRKSYQMKHIASANRTRNSYTSLHEATPIPQPNASLMLAVYLLHQMISVNNSTSTYSCLCLLSYFVGSAMAAALTSGFTCLAEADNTASSSSSSIQSPSSTSGSPTTALHTLCHIPFFSTIARIITTGRCHTLAQNKPLAEPLCPSSFQKRTASFTSQMLTGALASAKLHSVTP